MSRDWEATFATRASPRSDTEQAKCDNAERSAPNAIKASAKVKTSRIEVFTQGSFAQSYKRATRKRR